MDILQSIDPTVVAIVLGLIVLSFIIMMFIYIPRIDKLRKLEDEKKQYKSERDYAVEQWSIAMISGNRQKDKILTDLKNTEGRKNQYSKIAKTMAEAYDKVKKDLCIDIPKPELPVVTFTVDRIIPREDVMMFSDECISDMLHKDMAFSIGEKILKDSLAEMIYIEDKQSNRFTFSTTVKVVDPKISRTIHGLYGFRRE